MANPPKNPPLNVLGTPLEDCSHDPVTGYYRDGMCNTCEDDVGNHTVCAVMTDEFLAYSKYFGNDLSTPRPEYRFPGLKAGNKWCLCANRFLQAHVEGVAPQVSLVSTHQRALEVVSLKVLSLYAIDAAQNSES